MRYRLQLKLHFSAQGHPTEDWIEDKAMAVAVFDGVTLLHQIPYPNPSPAAEAARRGAEASVEYVLKHEGEAYLIKNAFHAASSSIRVMNEKYGITPKTVNFLSRQYAAAVGALAVFDGKTLRYGQINDCGVMVCAPSGEILDNLITDKSLIGPYLKAVRTQHGFKRGSPEEHVYVRSQLVNNPKAEFEGKLMNDGVLTGEDLATKYVHSKQMNIDRSVKTIVYSDGFIDLLNETAFRQSLLSFEDSKKAHEYTEQMRQKSGSLKEASLAVIDISI